VRGHSIMAASRNRRQPFGRTTTHDLRRRLSGTVAAFALALVAHACSSSSVSLNAPSSAKCQVNVSNSVQTAPPSGAVGTLTIGTTRDCTWAVSSEVSWIVIVSGSSGLGDGAAAYRVAANTESSPRRGTIDVNSTQIAVAQDAACRFDVAVPNTTVSAQGASLSVTVQAGSTCGWTAASQSDWIVVTAGSSGSGNGTATLAVAANIGAARTGSVVVAGQTIAIAQAQAAPAPPPPAPSCDLSISPTSQTLPAEGGAGSVSVTVASGCAWSATSSADWIAVTGGASGTGAGQVRFSVAPNAGTASRQGVVTVGGRTFTVAQAGVSCTYAIQPANHNIAAGGGTVTVVVSAPGACTWTAHANAGWISIAGGASGSGNGSVTIAVSANSGDARTGTVSIADRTLTINQSAEPCSYAIAPTSASIAAAGGSGSVSVTAGGSCPWTATSNASWISIASGASGTGNGSVSLSVAANIGAARTGALTIGGQTFTVTQAAAACSYSIAPTSQAVPAAGGTGSVVVTSAAWCAWTAMSNADWLTITTGASGSGNATVGFAASANAGMSRIGMLTIAGQTVTVAQGAADSAESAADRKQ
jgi:BACON domain-containing protein/all-beta uncharacterized protein